MSEVNPPEPLAPRYVPGYNVSVAALARGQFIGALKIVAGKLRVGGSGEANPADGLAD